MIKTTGERREPVIVDFGLAHRDDPGEERLTRTGQAMGTLAYMAPEQVRGDLKEIGPACDIYALGVILYELLTGQVPFRGKGLAVVSEILNVPPPPPSARRSDLEPALDAICQKAMAKQAGDRYASMGELAAALTGFLRSPAATQPPASPAGPPDSASSAPASTEPPRAAGSDTLVAAFFERLVTEETSPSLIATPKPVVSPSPMPGHRRPGWPLRVAAAVVGVLLVGVIVFVATDKGRIRMVVNDLKAVVKIDGAEVRIESLGAPITLRAGAHALEVKWGDGQFKTRKFIVRRGANEDLRVDYEPIPAPRATASQEPAKAPEPAPTPAATADSTVAPQETITSSESAKAPKPAPTATAAADSTVLENEAIPGREPAKAMEPAPVPVVVADSTGPSKEITKSSSKKSVAGRRTGRGGQPPKLIANTIGMMLMLIPSGSFQMGSPDSDPDAHANEKPRHTVRITRPFYLGVAEVTQLQYLAVTGANPSYFKGSDDLPVEQVNWLDAVNYCNALSHLERLARFYRINGRRVDVPDWSGPGYRLPTEAEWEYACRAGSTTRYCYGDEAERLDEYAWYGKTGGNKTHPVGGKRPNGFGLYDMYGNASEWCWDWFDAQYYGLSPATDPHGPAQAAERVVRSGGWRLTPKDARSAYRWQCEPGYRGDDHAVGFRVARGLSDR